MNIVNANPGGKCTPPPSSPSSQHNVWRERKEQKQEQKEWETSLGNPPYVCPVLSIWTLGNCAPHFKRKRCGCGFKSRVLEHGWRQSSGTSHFFIHFFLCNFPVFLSFQHHQKFPGFICHPIIQRLNKSSLICSALPETKTVMFIIIHLYDNCMSVFTWKAMEAYMQ